MGYLYGLRLSSVKRGFYNISAFASFVCEIFVLSAPKKGLAPMAPAFSPTKVVAEPAYAELRETETPELREVRDFFAKPSGSSQGRHYPAQII